MGKFDTPMLRQYSQIKQQHDDAILFFRLGDFYEMFDTDAHVAAKALSLTLTGRGKDENRIAMCGVPHHAADAYIAKLVTQGFKVAICEQVEEADQSKGLTERAVTKIITPGTVTDDALLDEAQNNYLMAVTKTATEQLGYSVCDISTGQLYCGLSTAEALPTLLAQYHVKELIITPAISGPFPDHILVNTAPDISPDAATTQLQSQFNISSLSAFGLDSLTDALPSCATLLNYLKQTQKSAIGQLTKITPIQSDDYMGLDHATIHNLELIGTPDKPNLVQILNHTKTAMGARQLRHDISHPLKSVARIEKRLNAVAALRDDLLSREEIRESLHAVYDLHRLITRISAHTHNPRDLMALCQSLTAITALPSTLAHIPVLSDLAKALSEASEPNGLIDTIAAAITTTIVEDPPATIRDGDIIKPGVDEALDKLKQSFKDIKDWIATLEPQQRDATGIKALKVGYNKVFGYYFECPKGSIDKIPEHYIRKQTLTNAERYITPELKEKETILLNGQTQQIEKETELYTTLLTQLNAHTAKLQDLAERIAALDVTQSLATAAQKYNYTRPTFDTNSATTLTIENGRHPILEHQHEVTFIANDISMDIDKIFLITGPNMAGKSTVMRQVALISLMAHIGSFVPADTCHLSPIDQLFTRIGAMDNLYAGQSTFMVEMLESANILNNATTNSLIILDEIGRGTSTVDGMSLAGAITDHIATTIQARTLFATHYHELLDYFESTAAIGTYSMDIIEDGDAIIFTYKLIKGAANKSFGIHVAKMAGIPAPVIQKAEELLATLEQAPSQTSQLSLF